MIYHIEVRVVEINNKVGNVISFCYICVYNPNVFTPHNSSVYSSGSSQD